MPLVTVQIIINGGGADPADAVKIDALTDKLKASSDALGKAIAPTGEQA